LLLRQAVTVGLVLGGWLIWSDVLPALRILDNVELWSRSVKVVERFEDASGNVRMTEDVELAPTTLRHGVIAAMILLATVVLGRNLPALLEITVLSRLPLDRGGRHAVSILLHYAVALTGLIVALRTLSIDWASVQWLAAGITVGLGFGLQEIFANFVSGMILLFERPIRVGDIVTLGDVSGCVTSIRIRATTVTDWDRKELIVPNKDLVTGRLLNWTLSDTTNRIVIELAIPFRSDASRARRVMEQVVASHPHVLSDPAPSVTFESFTEGTLKFVIRAYLASLDVRLQTVHELHLTLHQKLQSEGIGIALPQRDINVRDASSPALAPERVVTQRHSDAA
jgi:potassium efflux system protein